jgi:transcriptional regulator of arginine metabolism
MKSWRQSQILDVIDKVPVASQEALREHLEGRGIQVTQATLSRDLKQLGLVKRAGDGAYVRPGADQGGAAMGEQMKKAVASLVRSFERVDTHIVVRTDAGQANGLAVLMDRSRLAEVAGTLAGDDTILLVCRGLENAVTMEQKLSQMVKGA